MQTVIYACINYLKRTTGSYYYIGVSHSLYILSGMSIHTADTLINGEGIDITANGALCCERMQYSSKIYPLGVCICSTRSTTADNATTTATRRDFLGAPRWLKRLCTAIKSSRYPPSDQSLTSWKYNVYKPLSSRLHVCCPHTLSRRYLSPTRKWDGRPVTTLRIITWCLLRAQAAKLNVRLAAGN